MKIFLLCVLGGLTLATAPLPARSATDFSTSSPKDAPFVGMTKTRAATYYGEPFTRETLSQGERWYYRLKFSEVYGKAYVPFYFDGYNVRVGTIDFGADDRAKSFNWRRVTLQG